MIAFTRSKQIFLCLLFALAMFTRFAGLETVPKGLHADEASFLLNTQSLLLTGKDEDNQRFPLWLRSYIDSKPALYSYLQLPFIAGLGPTTMASRLPAALLGFISLGLSYWVLSQFLHKRYAVIATILLLVSPWHIVVSRATQEVILAFVLVLVALGSFYKYQLSLSDRPGYVWFGLFLLSSVLSMYVYHSYKIFLPLLLIGWTVLEFWFSPSKNKTNLKSYRYHLPLVCILSAAAVLTFAIPQSLERFNAINVFHEPEPLLIAEEQVRRATGVTPLFLLRVFYNKLVSYSLQIFTLYSQHFSLDFLFISGGHPARYSTPFHGLLYMIEILLVPLGMFISLHRQQLRKTGWFLLWWLLISPLPAALTSQEVPSMIRSFPMLIPLVVFVSVALGWLWNHRGSVLGKVMLGMVTLGYIWGTSYFAQQYIVQKNYYQPWHRNTSEEKLAAKLVTIEHEYDIIDIATVRDLYAYLALEDTSLIPLLQMNPQARVSQKFALGKYRFNPRGCGVAAYSEELNVLQVVSAGCDTPDGYEVLETISYDDRAQVYNLLVKTQTALE